MTGVIGHWLNQPVTIVNPGSTTTNAYGEVINVAGVPVVTSGYLYQQTTVEFLVDRDTIVSHWFCDLHAEDVVTAQATVQFGSQVFQVDGAPQNVWNPRLQVVDHIECKLLTVAG